MQDAQKLHAIIEAETAAERFSGVVLVAEDGAPVFHRAYGLANRRYNIPNQPDTKFNIGSMNKMFTGVAITQFIQAGKLSPDDRVGQHLPDYPNRAVAETVTIHHLLTHTAGLVPHFWTETFKDGAKDRWRTVDEFLSLFVDDPLQSAPGERFKYSNAGYVVLGMIIESVTGQDYFDFIREHVYAPAGMDDTDCYDIDEPVPNLAIGYTKHRRDDSRPEMWRSNSHLIPHRGGPMGGGYSTALDLLAFVNALQGHRLLNQKHTKLALTPHVAQNDIYSYGYGFGIEDWDGVRHFGHTGGYAGLVATLRVFMDENLIYVTLANLDYPTDTDLVDKLVFKHLTGV